jgi:PAS domain S-box-containing protein
MLEKLRWSKTIRARLTFGFGMILLLNCISAAIGYGSLQRLRNSSQVALDNAAQLRELSLELNNHFLKARQAEERYLNRWQTSSPDQDNPKLITTHENELAQARLELKQLRALDQQEPELADEVAFLESLFDNYESAFVTTVRRIAQEGSRYQIHERLQTELNTLLADGFPEQNIAFQTLLRELEIKENLYFETGDQQHISDVRTSLNRLVVLLGQIENSPATEQLDTLTQNYIANLNKLLLLDQQVRVNRIIATNIHQEIDQIIADILTISATKTTKARAELSSTARQSSAALLVTAITALALSIWASLWLGRRIMTPLTELSATAERIAQGDLNHTLEIDSDDEFALVAHAFNKMMAQLRQTLDDLEQRVVERTQALTATNQTLESQTKFLEAAMERLHHSEANYRLLVDHLQAGVVVHAPDTHIEMCNQAAANLLGITVEHIKGLNALSFQGTLIDDNGSDIPPDQYPVNQVLANKAPLKNRVLGLRRPDHSPLWALVNAFPTLDSDGQVTRVVVTFTDITDHKLAEEALRYRALHDALTGLPNRALLLERLNHALHQAQRYADHLFAVLFIDLGELQKRIYQLSGTDENVVFRQ